MWIVAHCGGQTELQDRQLLDANQLEKLIKEAEFRDFSMFKGQPTLTLFWKDGWAEIEREDQWKKRHGTSTV